ncbi:hypothetical protein [Streptomyces albidoflavus]|nr:hypothetical protein [Streptomyces albidoflavus]
METASESGRESGQHVLSRTVPPLGLGDPRDMLATVRARGGGA